VVKPMQYPTFHSKCGIYGGLILKRVKHNRLVMVAVRGQDVAHPYTYIHTYIHTYILLSHRSGDETGTRNQFSSLFLSVPHP
jgi:hypothetical protein